MWTSPRSRDGDPGLGPLVGVDIVRWRQQGRGGRQTDAETVQGRMGNICHAGPLVVLSWRDLDLDEIARYFRYEVQRYVWFHGVDRGYFLT